MIDELKQIEIQKVKKSPNYESEVNRINSCKNIIELGYTVGSAIDTLISYGLPVVLREADKVIIPHDDVSFNSDEDFIGVHKDEFMPVNSIIQTPTEAGATLRTHYFIGGRYLDIESKFFRDSVHYALNGEVEEIGSVGSSWDRFPFVFLTKLKKIPIGKDGHYSLGDTFTDKHVELDEDTWILCPQGFKEQILNRNPRIKI